MYTIGQFSIMTKIPAKTLRYYDEIDLLKPARVDTENNYRYYDEKSLLSAQQILIYKSCELPLDEIKSLLDSEMEQTDLYQILSNHLNNLGERISGLQKSCAAIEKIMQTIKNNGLHEVTVNKHSAEYVLSIRKMGNHAAIGTIMSTLFETAVQLNLKVTGPHTIIWHEGKNFDSETMDMEIIIPVEQKENIHSELYTIKNCQRYCELEFTGSFSVASMAYDKIYSFIEMRGLLINGPVEETYYSEGKFFDPFSLKTRVSVPVREAE